MHKWLLAAVITGLGAAAMAQVTISPGGQSLQQLAQQGKLVTIILEGADGPVEVPNLRIAEVHDAHFTAGSDSGGDHFFTFTDVVEVRVQDGQVEEREFTLPTALTGPQQQVVRRGIERAADIFNQTQDDQSLRIRAAAMLSCAGDANGRAYLLSLARSGDIETELEAATYLFLAGDPAAVPEAPFPVAELNQALGLASTTASPQERRPLFPGLIASGLSHGSREVRAQAAVLAGLADAKSTLRQLDQQMNDRMAELAAPAAKAMANLGQKDAIPRLLDMMMEQTESKGEAAIYGLALLGDEETAETVLQLVPSAAGTVKLRLAKLLFVLGDPQGRRMLESIMREMPTIADQAALVLAEQGIWDAIQALKDRLDKRENPTEENLRYRAQAAAALIRGGDASGLSRLAELLRRNEPAVTEKICEVIAELGQPSMLELLKAPMESDNPGVTLDAVFAAVALANGDFRTRINQYRASQ
jgi:HEAT repeat protein